MAWASQSCWACRAARSLGQLEGGALMEALAAAVGEEEEGEGEGQAAAQGQAAALCCPEAGALALRQPWAWSSPASRAMPRGSTVWSALRRLQRGGLQSWRLLQRLLLLPELPVRLRAGLLLLLQPELMQSWSCSSWALEAAGRGPSSSLAWQSRRSSW